MATAATALFATWVLTAPTARAGTPMDGFVRGEQVFSATLAVGAREKPTGIEGDGTAVYVVHVEGTASTSGGRTFDALYQHRGPDAGEALPSRSPRIEFRAGAERVYRDFEPYAAAGGEAARWPSFREDHVYEFLWRPRAGGAISVVSPPLTLGTPATDALRGEFTVTLFRAVPGEARPEPKEPTAPLKRTEPAHPKDPAAPNIPKTDPRSPIDGPGMDGPRGDGGKAGRTSTAPTHAPRLASGALADEEWVSSAHGFGRVHVENDRLVLEAGASDFGARCFSKVAIEGDFDLTIPYTLIEWSPGPGQSPTFDVYVSAEAGITASTIQVSRADFEDTGLVFVQPGPDPTPAVGGKEGRLRVRRVGSAWTVWQRGTPEWALLAQIERPMGASAWIGFGLTKGGDGAVKVAVRPSWTEANSAAEAADAAEVGGKSSPAGEAPSIVGTWEWSPTDAGTPGPGGRFVFAADQSVAGTGGTYGTWVQDGRTVVIRWSTGSASLSLTVSEDGRTLTGRDAAGTSLRATKRP